MKTNRLIAHLKRVYNTKDVRGKGRLCMLLSGMMAGIVGQLSGGLFYTSFLLQYGLDKSKIGILTFIPHLACLLNIFSPYILERFRKRKYLLFGAKLTAHFINIVGITLVSQIIGRDNPKLLTFCFVVLTFTANAITQIFSSGFSAWNANFLPDDIRVDYFTTTSCINAAFSYAVVLAVSFIGDHLSGGPHELMMLTAIRYIAFALAVVDCIIWLVPKEFEYAKTTKPKLSNIFTLPFRHKKFLGTIMIAAAYNFVNNLPNATLDAYVRQDLGISYTLCNGINATYFIFFILFTGMWKKFISKHYWFKAFGIAMFIQSLTHLLYTFVMPGTAYTEALYVTVRLSQHVLGVVMNTINSSLIYINLPDEDRTNYLAFHTILINLAAFSSKMLGTALNTAMHDGTVPILGMNFSSTQIMLFLCFVGQIIVGSCCIAFRDKLTPDAAKVRKTA